MKEIYFKIKELHVLAEHEVRGIAMKHLREEGLEMDSMTAPLARFVLNANGKYYLMNLQSEEITTTRNLILEIMMNAEKGLFKKANLVREV